MNVRLKKNLQDQEAFDQWLQPEHLNYSSFQQRSVLEMKLNVLKQRIAAPELESYFDTHRASFDELKLSCLVTTEETVAQPLQEAAVNGGEFRQLSTEYATAHEQAHVSYVQNQMQRRMLPDEMQEPLSNATMGEVIGPMMVNGMWSVFCVEDVIPVELGDGVKHYIEYTLFKQWLNDKLHMKI